MTVEQLKQTTPIDTTAPAGVGTVDRNSTPSLPPEAPSGIGYYTDTISAAGEDLPTLSQGSSENAASTKVKEFDEKYSEIENKVDELLKMENINFEKLQSLIYKLMMAVMRASARNSHEFIIESTDKIRAHAAKVQGTYNQWPGLVVTWVSAGLGIGAGVMGVSPLFPASVFAAETAKVLQGAAYSASTMSTGVSGVGSIFNSKSEGVRGVHQIELRLVQDKNEDSKGVRNNDKSVVDTAAAAYREFNKNQHDVMMR